MPRSEIEKCLDGKVNAGAVTRAQAEEVLRSLRKAEGDFARWNHAGEAQRKAEAKVAFALEADSRRTKFRQAKHLMALKKAVDAAETHQDGIIAGIRGLLDRSGKKNSANVATRADTRRGDFHAMFAKGLLALRPRMAGIVSNERGMENFVRALFGETVTPTGVRVDADSNAIVKAWRETTDFTRKLGRRAGADIRFRHDWHLPQRFEPTKLKPKELTIEQAYPAWRAELDRDGVSFGRLARDRMLHEETGEPLTDAELELRMKEVFKALVSRGLSEIVPGGDPSFRVPVKRLEHSRFLQFKTADDWLFMHKTYGRGSIFSALAGHLDFMARELALIEILGPKHNLVMQQLLDKARLAEAGVGKPAGLARRAFDVARGQANKVWVIEAVYDKITGKLDSMDDAQMPMLLRTMEEARSVVAAAQLGSAIFSATGDLKTLSTTAHFNGLNRTRAMREALVQLASPEHREAAIARGLIAENVVSVGFASNRYQDRISEGTKGAWLAQLTTSVTGLNADFQAKRHAFGLEFLATLHESSHLPFDQLEPKLLAALKRHLITEADWNVIRSTAPFELNGAKFTDPTLIRRRTDISEETGIDVSTKMMDMIHEETDAAVISKTPTSDVLTTLGTRRGTVAGQLMRSVAQYKNFIVTHMFTHGQRAMAIGGLRGARYFGQLAIGMSLVSAVGMQMREIAKGREPLDMTDPAFWGAALLQGGGLGIIGDFLYSLEESRYGKNFTSTIAGPMVGLVQDTLELTSDNIQEFAKGEDTNFGREATQFLRRYNPTASWWFSRTLVDRILWDSIQEEVDPEYRRSFRRMEDFRSTEFSQKYWWRPGALAPERAPDLGAAIGGSE